MIIKGCRQCGKTFSVLEFAKKNYKHVVYLNFFENPDYASVFAGSLDIDNIVMLLSALLGKEADFETGETVLVLDEIQDCPEARTALKFFRIDGRYDVIGTGSLLDVKGYGKEPKSVPVGSETVIDMYPLDFEEFLWANGISEPVIDMLQKALDTETPVPDALHSRMKQLLLQYAVVGGMPDAVQTFVDSKQMNEVLRIQRDIVRSYEDDMVKYAEKKDKSRIKECFQSIPHQLAKENKKFQYSVVRKGSTAAKYAGSLQWIEDAGIISRCYNLSITELPLDGNAEEDTFKVYMRDMGLFVSMLEDGRTAILKSPCVEDAEKLLNYIKTSCGETEYLARYPEEWNTTVEQEEAWVNRLRSSPDTLGITCYVDGEVAGNCEISFRGGMKTSHRATIAIAILKDYWNLGIGSAMFEELVAAAQNRGTEIMELEFIEGNDRARHLYEKFGFRVASEKPNAFKLKDGTYRNEFYMQKYL